MIGLLLGSLSHIAVEPALAAAGPSAAPQALPIALQEPHELVRGALPDPGPRFERLTDNGAWSRFEQAVTLYVQGRYGEARAIFMGVLREQAASPLASSAQAFMVESSLKSGDANVRPMEIVEQYRMLMRDEPTSTNAKRAAWRIGDLYRIEGWYQEAQVAYQHALSLSSPDSYDANRALLGLGYALRGTNQWKDSEQAFDNVRKRTTDPSLLVSASLGQAHSFYRDGRMKEADTLFESVAGRWPAAFRKDPYALLRYADTAGEFHRLPVMRTQLLHFYNLYPARTETPFVLGHIADSYKEAGRWDEAIMFYAALLSQYPEASIAPAARLRYADAQEQRDPEDGLVNLRQTVAAGLSNIVPAPGAIISPRRLFEESATQYEDSPVGSEALFHLGETFERAGKRTEALAAYERVVSRAGKLDNDPWPEKSGARLVTFLRPLLESAVKTSDDFELLSLFHRHGPLADRLYAGTDLLLNVADAHQRLGFPVAAARLYQSLIRDPKAPALHEAALIGLGRSYLEQKDARAARSVFERYRLQFPVGRLDVEALLGLLTAFQLEKNVTALIKLGRQWLQHHPRHPNRIMVQLKLANGLLQDKQDGEGVALYDEIVKRGLKLAVPDMLRYADASVRLNRQAPALALYKQALIAGPSPEQETRIQFQIVRLAQATKQKDLARNGLRHLDEHDDSLVRRVSAVLQTEWLQPTSAPGGRK
ncbi:MAG: protein of unknown function, TPR-like [Nitrospira sp.]|nr:protein of unknown function, TPR-like [Nitrospira sp.]